MRVFIADDHGIVRSGLRMLLEQQDDIEVIAEASDGAEARDMAIRERPDLAILDVKMPKLTGLQATREIKRQAPEVSVLILSMHDDERYLFEALKAGASGYVLKAQADTDLLAAIRAVERGEPFLTPEAQRVLIKDVLAIFKPSLQTLRGFRANQGLLLAGAVAYYALLSIVPMLILLVIALSHVVGEAELLEATARYLDWLVPGQGGAVTGELARFLQHRQVLGLVLLGTMVFFSSLAFTVL